MTDTSCPCPDGSNFFFKLIKYSNRTFNKKNHKKNIFAYNLKKNMYFCTLKV